MRKRSKRYREMAAAVGEEALVRAHPTPEAIGLVKKGASVKFNETVELAVNLNIDPNQSDQLVRGSFSLPHGTGKRVRVIAFAEGDAAKEAAAAGAMEVGGEDLVKKILDGWLDFDLAVAHPGMMKHVGKLGKALGPKGLMPSPKSGTVTPDIGTAVREFAAGRIEFRNDKHGCLHIPVGKADFDAGKLAENIDAFLAHVVAIRPAAVKGEFVKSVYVSTTMGLGFRIAV